MRKCARNENCVNSMYYISKRFAVCILNVSVCVDGCKACLIKFHTLWSVRLRSAPPLHPPPPKPHIYTHTHKRGTDGRKQMRCDLSGWEQTLLISEWLAFNCQSG